MGRAWSHFSRHEDDSYLQQIEDSELSRMRELHEGLEEVHVLVDDLRGDCDGFDYRPQVKEIAGRVEDLRAAIESDADAVGGSI